MRTSERKGAIVILVALLMVALLGFGAFAVDISQMQAYKSELRRTADAAVLAATLQLLHDTDHVNAQVQADLMLSDNPVFGGAAGITSFEYGTYDDVAGFTMCTGCSAVANAIRLTARGPERGFYLAQFIGGTDFSLSIQATAWLPVAATPCVAPWVVLETDWIASGVAAHSNSVLRGMATTAPGPGSKSFIPKRHDPDPAGTDTATFGAINLPAYNDGIPPPLPELLAYAQDIARLGACYSLEAFDVVQAKLTGLDDATIDGVSGIGGVSNLCAQLTVVACYNRGGQVGVAVRLPIVRPATSALGLQCAANPYFLLPAGFNELPSGGAICHEVIDVRTFVLVRADQSASVEKGLVLAVYAGNDTDGPVRGYAQRPILVQ